METNESDNSRRYRLGCFRVDPTTKVPCPNLAMYREHRANLPPSYICMDHAANFGDLEPEQRPRIEKLPAITNPTCLRIWDENGIVREAVRQ